MRAVVQRVSEAAVVVDGQEISRIGTGLLVLLGVEIGDTEKEGAFLADKIINLRIFPDAAGKMNLSVSEIGGEILIVSQFTIVGDCRKGRRPSYSGASPPERARDLCDLFNKELRARGIEVKTGEFQAMMKVSLINDGPVTLLLDSRKKF